MSRSFDPQKIDGNTWYYEEVKSITVVHEIFRDEIHIRTVVVKIPAKKLVKSLMRMGFIGTKPEEATTP